MSVTTRLMAMVGVAVILVGCASSDTPTNPQPTADQAVVQPPQGSPIPTVPAPTALALNANQGEEIGMVYEAFLSPHQEPGEEEDMPGIIPDEFRSTTPSFPRNQRTARGHGTVRFTKDLSKAFVDVKVEGLNVAEVNLFHIHCGKPDMLGPILIDFAHSGNLQDLLGDGTMSVVITNEDIEKVSESGHGLVGAFTSGCPVVVGLPDKVSTVASMAYIAEQGELYFNLHTTGQTYYGMMRGQLRRVEP